MLKKFIATSLFAAAFTVSAQAENVAIGGNYKVEGTNINGTTYTGEATITVTSDTTCEIHWVTGGTTSDGICMRNDASFSAAYQMGDVVGLLSYKVADDGTLYGLWTVAGNGGNGTEVLTPVR